MGGLVDAEDGRFRKEADAERNSIWGVDSTRQADAQEWGRQDAEREANPSTSRMGRHFAKFKTTIEGGGVLPYGAVFPKAPDHDALFSTEDYSGNFAKRGDAQWDRDHAVGGQSNPQEIDGMNQSQDGGAPGGAPDPKQQMADYLAQSAARYGNDQNPDAPQPPDPEVIKDQETKDGDYQLADQYKSQESRDRALADLKPMRSLQPEWHDPLEAMADYRSKLLGDAPPAPRDPTGFERGPIQPDSPGATRDPVSFERGPVEPDPGGAGATAMPNAGAAGAGVAMGEPTEDYDAYGRRLHPGPSDATLGARDQQQKTLQARAGNQLQYAEQERALADKQAAEAGKAEVEATVRQNAFDMSMKDHQDEIDNARKHLDSQRVDPDAYWNNHFAGPVGGRIIAGVAVMAQGFANGWNKIGGNSALDSIKSDIKGAVDAQEKSYNRGLTKIKGMENDYSRLRDMGLDSVKARAELNRSHRESVMDQMRAIAAQGAGTDKAGQLQGAMADLEVANSTSDDATHAAAVLASQRRADEVTARGRGAAAHMQARREHVSDMLLAAELKRKDDKTSASTARAEKQAHREEEDDAKKVDKYGNRIKHIVGPESRLKDLESGMPHKKDGSLDEGADIAGMGTFKQYVPAALLSDEGKANRTGFETMFLDARIAATGVSGGPAEMAAIRKAWDGANTDADHYRVIKRLHKFIDATKTAAQGSEGPKARRTYEENSMADYLKDSE